MEPSIPASHILRRCCPLWFTWFRASLSLSLSKSQWDSHSSTNHTKISLSLSLIVKFINSHSHKHNLPLSDSNTNNTLSLIAIVTFTLYLSLISHSYTISHEDNHTLSHSKTNNTPSLTHPLSLYHTHTHTHLINTISHSLRSSTNGQHTTTIFLTLTPARPLTALFLLCISHPYHPAPLTHSHTFRFFHIEAIIVP